MSQPTPKSCFAELEPVLDEIARLVAMAPLEQKHREGLALLVAGYAFGIVAAAMDKHPSEAAHEIGDLIAAVVKTADH